MTDDHTKTLRAFQAWRTGAGEPPDPAEVTRAIDAAIATGDRLAVERSQADEYRRIAKLCREVGANCDSCRRVTRSAAYVIDELVRAIDPVGPADTAAGAIGPEGNPA